VATATCITVPKHCTLIKFPGSLLAAAIMVLDPLSAVSLAGTVLQFVEFTGKLLTNAHELLKSPEGALESNMQLEFLAADLRRISQNLRAPFHEVALGCDPKEEEDLRQVCAGCDDVATELSARLGGLKRNGTHQKWSSLQKAIKTAWTQDEVNALISRMAAYRDAIQLHILVGLR
jgi:hypothetical protein